MEIPRESSRPVQGVLRRDFLKAGLVAEAAVGLNPLLYFAAPYEEMRLK